jgi:hypothetical protein
VSCNCGICCSLESVMHGQTVGFQCTHARFGKFRPLHGRLCLMLKRKGMANESDNCSTVLSNP